MATSLQKLLFTYFGMEELKDALASIGEPLTGTKDQLVARIIATWESHNRDIYDLLDFAETYMLRDMCKDYNLDSYGKHEILKRRLEKAQIIKSASLKTEEFSKKLKSQNNNQENLHPKIYYIMHSKSGRTSVALAVIGIGLTIFFGILSMSNSPQTITENTNQDFTNVSPGSLTIANNTFNNFQIETLMKENIENNNRPWIAGFEIAVLEDEIWYSFQNFGNTPNTGGILTFQVSDALITRENFELGHTKTVPLQVLMPEQKLTSKFTGGIMEVANKAQVGESELYLAVVFDYTFGNEGMGKYGFIGKFNPERQSFDLVDTWAE